MLRIVHTSVIYDGVSSNNSDGANGAEANEKLDKSLFAVLMSLGKRDVIEPLGELTFPSATVLSFFFLVKRLRLVGHEGLRP